MQIKVGAVGVVIKGLEDINQELWLIFSTPLGSIPHQPDFGSRIPEYVDLPANIGSPLIVAEAYRAISANSTRFSVSKVSLASADPNGKLVFKITGMPTDSETDKEVTLTVLADYGTTNISLSQ